MARSRTGELNELGISPESASQSSMLIDQVGEWLMSQALGEASLESVFEGCCEGLLAAGLPLLRTHIAYRTLHPLYSGIGMTWKRGKPLEVERFPHFDGPPPERWLVSPHYFMMERDLRLMRRRLTGPQALLDFPILQEMRDQGATDYLAFLMSFGARDEVSEQDGVIGSWATDREGGFSDAEISALLALQQRLGVVCKMRTRSEIAQTVMTTYLGPDAGLRVLDGQIRRGDGESIRAAVWYSDMRGSTKMAENLPSDHYISALNAYFEATAGAVLAAGGDVLGFVGDAVLAIFPIRKGKTSPRQACRKALAASADAQTRLKALNAGRQEAGDNPLDFGIGLHVGDVVFGNIGVPERLAFSVIGPVANEAARLEALTKKLERQVVVSSAFARTLPLDWSPLGSHAVAGVAEPLDVFAPTGS